jgi:RNA polymerase sigma factor (sigma-70 family)
MKEGQRSFLQHIETLFDAGAIGEHTDRQLLQLFTGRDRTTAELAFTVLVKRHGPMIFRACRAILNEPDSAEDAFQATFLVLARKAPGLWVRGSLGPWLLAVARRVAYCARADASRRRAHEEMAAEPAAPAKEDQAWDDCNAIIHEELGRLPEKYRTAVLLCDLEGLTQEQAARHLGWPNGTVRSRLARGRQQLRDRLTRRGMAPTVVFAGQTPIIDVTSVSLVARTVHAALRLASGQAVIGATSSAIALMEGVLRIMFWNQLRMTAPVVLASALLCGTGLMGYRAMGLPQAPAAAGKQQPRAQIDPEGKPTVPASSGSESPELDAIGKARIEVATKLRNAAHRLWQAGEINVVEYLTVQKRFDEVVADVTVKTDADRVRFLEREVTTLKQIEDPTRELFRRGQVTQSDLLMVELARLDAEYALAKAKAKARGNSK